jgi:WhiB family redox-sensing transcriptional regulator
MKDVFLFNSAVPKWHKRAYCRYYDPELWFADGMGNAPSYRNLDQAKSICADCPVRRECLEDALHQESGRAAEARHGIRAGLTPADRYNLHRHNRKKAAA